MKFARKFLGGGGDHSLVIVESPKKARSINKFLGSKYVVKASMGHVRDLPKRKLGLDVASGYAPSYEVVPAKKETVSELKREAARAGLVYLATDPDREGEAIAWHLQQALGLPDERVRRVTFHEITERAVKDAFGHVGPINMEMVNAQQARRFLDRFVGYQLSPLLWSKVARNLSAGRVQSVAVRLIVDREREIRAFVTEEYWKITATVSPAGSTAESDRFEAALAEYEGKKFEAKTGPEAHQIRDVLASANYVVSRVDEADKLDKADPPFKTSTLQQQAAIRMRFAGKRTMKVAQELYEGIDVDGSGPVGLITYMRTDSLRVSEEAVHSVRELIERQYGPQIRSRQADSLRRRQERAGSPRGHPAHRPGPHAREGQGAPEPRPVPALSTDLRPLRRQPDGARRLHRHRRCHHRRAGTVQGPGESAQVRRPPQGLAAGRQTGRRAPAGARGEPAAGPARPERQPAFHPAAAAVHRGHPDQGPRKRKHRPAQHLCPDHPDDPGPALRRAQGAEILRHRPGDGGHRPAGQALPQDSRSQVHRAHGR